MLKSDLPLVGLVIQVRECVDWVLDNVKIDPINHLRRKHAPDQGEVQGEKNRDKDLTAGRTRRSLPLDELFL